MTLFRPRRPREMGKIFLLSFILLPIIGGFIRSIPVVHSFDVPKTSDFTGEEMDTLQTKGKIRWRVVLHQHVEISGISMDFYPQTANRIKEGDKRTERVPDGRVPFFPHIKKAAEGTGLNPHLISAVIKAESNFNPRALSASGAVGLMQLMPATASKMGVYDLFDPHENIQAGARYLSYCLEKFGDTTLALAAYNAGPALVARRNQVPKNDQTINFIKKVIRYKTTFEAGGIHPGGPYTIVMAPMVTIENGAGDATAADLLVLVRSTG